MKRVLFSPLRLAIVGIVLLNIAMLAGCNTVEGAGKDIENLGEAIQDGADG